MTSVVPQPLCMYFVMLGNVERIMIYIRPAPMPRQPNRQMFMLLDGTRFFLRAPANISHHMRRCPGLGTECECTLVLFEAHQEMPESVRLQIWKPEREKRYPPFGAVTVGEGGKAGQFFLSGTDEIMKASVSFQYSYRVQPAPGFKFVLDKQSKNLRCYIPVPDRTPHAGVVPAPVKGIDESR